MNNYEFHINRLKKSPIFAMSLGSKELFHSNFWAFLIEQEETREFIKVFFKNFPISNFKEVKREDKHRDITICDKDGKEFVIENKIKSYPDKEQLEKYDCECGIITGISQPPFLPPEKWHFIAYKEISSGLRSIAKVLDGFLRDLLNEYCDLLDSINAVLEICLKQTEGFISYGNENIKQLSEVRLLDVYQKNKADHFVLAGFGNTKEKYEAKASELNNNTTFYISRSYHNGKATLSFGFAKYYPDAKLFNDDTETESIGVQIEGNQFRLFKWNKDLSADETFNKYAELGWFENSFDKKTNRLFRENKTKMTKQYCKYSTNWVYQYFDIWDEENPELQSYKSIVELIDKELDKAFKFIK